MFGSSSVVVTVSGVTSMGGTEGIRMPQGPKFDDSGTKFPSWVAKQCGLLRRNVHYSRYFDCWYLNRLDTNAAV